MPIPYKVTCAICGNELVVSDRTMDSDGDIFIVLQPCETCAEADFARGRAEGAAEKEVDE